MRYLIVIVSSVLMVLHVQAGIFSKKRKPLTAKQVQLYIYQLQKDKDEDKREEAAKALSYVNTKEYPYVVPAMIYSLQADRDDGVRREIVKSLRRIEPKSQMIYDALKRTASSDNSIFVRLQARTAKLGYRVPKEQHAVSTKRQRPEKADTSPKVGKQKQRWNQTPVTEPAIYSHYKPLPLPPEQRAEGEPKPGPVLRSPPEPVQNQQPDQGPILVPPKQ